MDEETTSISETPAKAIDTQLVKHRDEPQLDKTVSDPYDGYV